MNRKLFLGLALLMIGAVIGCSTLSQQDVNEKVINALNRQDWVALRTLANPGMLANESIKAWESYARMGHAVRVGRLIKVDRDWKYHVDEQPCTMYSYAMTNKDGTPHPHWLQILVREDGGRSRLLDFWNFGW